MFLQVIFLLLPALTFGDIGLHLKGTTQDKSNIEYFGTLVDTAKYEDIAGFGLDLHSLKQAIKIYSGGEPREIFLKAPTVVEGEDSHNFFKQYHLKEVTRKITPKNGSLVDYKTEQVHLDSNYNIQTESRRTYFGTRDLIWATNGQWNNNAQLPKGEDKIYYTVEMGIKNLSPMVNSSFHAPYGKNVSENMYISVRKEFVHNKGHRGEFGLRVTKRIIDFKIDYTISLEGQIACFYPEGHKGEKVWGYDINSILRAANKPNILETSESLQVIFYSDPEIYPSSP